MSKNNKSNTVVLNNKEYDLNSQVGSFMDDLLEDCVDTLRDTIERNLVNTSYLYDLCKRKLNDLDCDFDRIGWGFSGVKLFTHYRLSESNPEDCLFIEHNLRNKTPFNKKVCSIKFELDLDMDKYNYYGTIVVSVYPYSVEPMYSVVFPIVYDDGYIHMCEQKR